MSDSLRGSMEVAGRGGSAQATYVRAMEITLAAIKDFAYVLDRECRFVYVNQPLLDLWGLSLDQAVGKNFLDLNYPEELALKLHRQLRQVVDTRQSLTDETEYVSPSGLPGWYEYIFSPVFGPDGEVEVVAGSTRIITERKRFEVEREKLLAILRAERANLAAVIEHAPYFICVFKGAQHVFEFANDQYHQLIGRRDVIGKSVREALPEIEGQGFVELLDSVYRSGERFVGNEMPVLLRLSAGGALDQRIVNFVYQAMRDDSGVVGIFVHGVDVTDMARARESERLVAEDALAAAEANAKFRAFFDQGSYFAGVMTLDGTVIEANRLCLDACGFTREQVIGKKFWDCGWWNRSPELMEMIRAGSAEAATGRTYRKETNYFLADGSERVADITLAPVTDESGRVLFIAPTGVDVTDRNRMAKEREHLLEAERAARGEAERASRIKDEFLATLSHELRTPLNAILGWSQILRGGAEADPADIRQGLEVIERNARAQTQIIEDLLDMSRIISGKVRLDVQQTDLASVVQAAIETAKPAANAKGVRIHAVLDPIAGPVSGDPNRLQQVFWNLLTNAVKFTPRGGHVQVRLERVDSHLEVSVTDTGEGLSPEFLPHVFDRFRQADSSTTRRTGGLGLGLSIVKQLIELHGGSVRARSSGIGKGSTFIVTLPLTVIHGDPETDADRRHPRTSTMLSSVSKDCAELAGVKLLVVDDEPDARAMLKRVLEDCKAVVTTAASAEEAVQLLKTAKFDVLVSDIGMPGEDGYALIKRLRSIGRAGGGSIPAIALTAYARAEDRVKAVVAGFQHHVSKPVEPAELIAMVASLSRQSDQPD